MDPNVHPLEFFKANNTVAFDLVHQAKSVKEDVKSAFRFGERSLLDLILRSKTKDLDLLLNDPDIEVDASENARWEPIRVLGQGGFGCVALFQKKINGKVVDSIAIKEAKYNTKRAYVGARCEEGVSSEAVLQFQINNMTDSHTLRLRRYKYLSQQEKTRMYLEYGQNRDLNVLRHRYRAWDKYLPELFLWKVFLSLAKAAEKMQNGYPPWKIMHVTQRKEIDLDAKVFMLHFDMKPHNVLLTDADPSATENYPEVRVADFGLSKIVRPLGTENPRDYWSYGTLNFRPPEQTNVGAQWTNPPNDQNRLPGRPLTRRAAADMVRKDKASHGVSFTAAHNIWAIGKVMSDLTYLEDREEYEKQMPAEDLEEETYARIGLDMIGVRDTKWYQVFSEELRGIITACLDIEANNRPTAEMLIAACEEGLQRYKALLSAMETATGITDDSARKLYFSGNEINDMRPGQCEFPKTKAVYRRLQAEANFAFDGDLKVPYKWQPIIDEIAEEVEKNGLWPPGVQEFRREAGKISFKPKPKDAHDQIRQEMNQAMNQLGQLISQHNGRNDQQDVLDELGILEELEARRNILLEAQMDVHRAFTLWKLCNPDSVVVGIGQNPAQNEAQPQGQNRNGTNNNNDRPVGVPSPHSDEENAKSKSTREQIQFEVLGALRKTGRQMPSTKEILTLVDTAMDEAVQRALDIWKDTLDGCDQLLAKLNNLGEDLPSWLEMVALFEQVDGDVDEAVELWQGRRRADEMRKARAEKRPSQQSQDEGSTKRKSPPKPDQGLPRRSALAPPAATLPTLEAIRASIPPEGVSIRGLIGQFTVATTDYVAFANLVSSIATRDEDTGLIFLRS